MFQETPRNRTRNLLTLSACLNQYGHQWKTSISGRFSILGVDIPRQVLGSSILVAANKNNCLFFLPLLLKKYGKEFLGRRNLVNAIGQLNLQIFHHPANKTKIKSFPQTIQWISYLTVLTSFPFCSSYVYKVGISGCWIKAQSHLFVLSEERVQDTKRCTGIYNAFILYNRVTYY